MNDETTKTLQQEANNAQPVQTTKKGTVMGRAGALAAGAVVGSSADYVVGQVYDKATAATLEDSKDGEETAHAETVDEAKQTSEANSNTDGGEVEYATADTINIARVDDAMTFSEAFAAAREQVGAGGVFEWHGKVYGTYYKEEWSAMSQEERSEWQSRIDYNEVLGGATHTASENHYATANSRAEAKANVDDTTVGEEATAEVVADTDVEVHVLGIAVQDNGQGGMATIAGMQIGEETAIVVDVETNGTIDIMGVDRNKNGDIEQNEWQDVSEAKISTGELVEGYVAEANVRGEQAVINDLDTGANYAIQSDGTVCVLEPSGDESSDILFEV